MGRTLIIALLVAASASAAPLRVRLDYQRESGAETCGTQDEFEARVSARLGSSPFDPSSESVVAVAFSRVGRALRARLSLPTANGVARRQFDDGGASCESLIDAAVLAVCLAVDPQLNQPAPAPEPTPAPPPAPAPRVPVMPSVAAPPAPEPAPEPVSLRWHFGVGGGATLGVAPSVSGAVLAHADVAVGRANFGLELRFDLPSSRPVGSGTVSSSLMSAAVIPCAAIDRFHLCAVASAGAFSASSEGLATNTSLSAPFIQIGGRLSASFELARWLVLTPWVDVLGALTRIALVVDGESVWVTPPVGAIGGLRLSVPWP